MKPGLLTHIFSRSFYQGFDRLARAEKAAVRSAIIDFTRDPSLPSLSLHRIDRARDKRFWTIRANSDLRIALWREGSRSVLCHVGHHDDVYEWASRRIFEENTTTGAMQIVEINEIVREEVRTVVHEAPNLPLLASEDSTYLLSLGVPECHIDHIRTLDRDQLTLFVDQLPEEAGVSILDLLDGKRPAPRPVERDFISDSFNHPDAKLRFHSIITSDDAELDKALKKPWAEWLVFLHPTQRKAVERNFTGPGRVTGAAGTGKSVVAMHRAARLARSAPNARILLTTYTKILAARLSEGMDALLGASSKERLRVEVVNFHSYAMRCGAKSKGRIKFIDSNLLCKLLNETHGDLDRIISNSFLESEWENIIDYWAPKTYTEYTSFRRKRLDRKLMDAHGEKIWDNFVTMRQIMKSKGIFTFADICDLAREQIETNAKLSFDHVIVDEAQDLGPRELLFIKALVPDGANNLFFAGDLGQRIYGCWDFPWLPLGLDVRGRAIKLTTNYRTTRQISQFAEKILPEMIADIGDDGATNKRNVLSCLQGVEPEIIGCDTHDEEADALARWLSTLLDSGVQPNEIAILARRAEVAQRRPAYALNKVSLQGEMLIDEGWQTKDAVVLATLHKAKGLEFRAVAIIGCDDGLIPMGSVLNRTQPDMREAKEEQERNLFYVACTRARDRLLITYVKRPSPYLTPLIAQYGPNR